MISNLITKRCYGMYLMNNKQIDLINRLEQDLNETKYYRTRCAKKGKDDIVHRMDKKIAFIRSQIDELKENED
jgi:predicted secreted protein